MPRISIVVDVLTASLRQLLLKSLCVQLADTALVYACQMPASKAQPIKEKVIIISCKSINKSINQVRNESIATLSLTGRDAFTELYASLKSTNETLDAFHDAVYAICAPDVCSVKVSMVQLVTQLFGYNRGGWFET